MRTTQGSEPGNPADLISLCAAGEAAFQRAAHQGLGRPWVHGDGVAWAPDGPGHQFLFAAVTLVPRPALPDVLRGRVCDSFAALDSGDLPGPGWRPQDADPWMVRPPLPVFPAAPTPGLRVSRVETDAETVQQLLDAWKSGGLGVAGPEATLSALQLGQVDELIITGSPDTLKPVQTLPADAAPGDVQAATSNPAGAGDEGRLKLSDELITRAQQTAARIRFIEDASLLADVGGVGAFLRFRI